MISEDFLKNAWRTLAGLPEIQPVKLPSLEILKETEWSKPFEQYMRNRLIMGGIRYGRLKSPGKPQYDRMRSIEKRAEKYKQSGNLEYLVDIAVLALCEFEEGDHPKRHFKAIDDGEHTDKINH